MSKRRISADGRELLTIGITPDAARKINEFVNARGGRGMKKFVLSRLIEWFAEQRGSVKNVVLGWAEGDLREAHVAMLRQLADELEGKPARSETQLKIGMPLREAAMPVPKGGMDMPGGKKK